MEVNSEEGRSGNTTFSGGGWSATWGGSRWMGRKCRCLQDTLLVDVFLLEESHGQRSLVSYSPWDRTEVIDWGDSARIGGRRRGVRNKAQIFDFTNWMLRLPFIMVGETGFPDPWLAKNMRICPSLSTSLASGALISYLLLLLHP